MPSSVTRCYLTRQAEETQSLGIRLGQRAGAGDIVACYGTLGAGKTTFVQGFAVGMGVSPEAYVRSPTFALVHTYDGHLPLYHFDFYRLSAASEVQGIGFEDYIEAAGVIIIEWADKFPEFVPQGHLAVRLAILDLDQRTIEVTAATDVYHRYVL